MRLREVRIWGWRYPRLCRPQHAAVLWGRAFAGCLCAIAQMNFAGGA